MFTVISFQWQNTVEGKQNFNNAITRSATTSQMTSSLYKKVVPWLEERANWDANNLKSEKILLERIK